MLTPRIVDVAGVATAVIDTGPPPTDSGRPPLLLLHGSGPGAGAVANWRLVLPDLARTRRVIAPDQLGFAGTATGEARRFGRAAWTAHALAVLDTLGVDDVDVIGNSMGGAIALSMAVARPQRVRRLVTMGTVGVAMPLPPGLDMVWGYTPSTESMARVVRLFTDDERLVTSDLIELRLHASEQPAVRDSWAAMFPPPRQRWLDDLALGSDELRTLRQPTLLVHGRDDRVIPLASSLALLDLLPDVELHVFGGCGHWAMIERAPAFVALVSAFLGR